MPDNAVYLDNGAYLNLDLSDCGVPQEIRALDWKNNQGELHHYDTSIRHVPITELPDWAIKCVEKWEAKYKEEQDQGLL
jgi:hypothetical protein